jgi:hypothetical protein
VKNVVSWAGVHDELKGCPCAVDCLDECRIEREGGKGSGVVVVRSALRGMHACCHAMRPSQAVSMCGLESGRLFLGSGNSDLEKWRAGRAVVVWCGNGGLGLSEDGRRKCFEVGS